MRIAIVGATGVLGRSLVPLLAARGHTVLGLARAPAARPAGSMPGVTYVAIDLLAPETPDRLPVLLDGYDAVVHAATAIPANPAAPGAWEATARLRTEGVRRLLAAAQAAEVRGYIQQSIVMAYPDGGDRWLDEATPFDTTPARQDIVQPVAEMETLVHGVDTARLRWCVLRGGFFTGPGTVEDALVEAVRTGSAVVPGDGSAYFSPVHVADMAMAVTAAIERLPAAATLNIVGEPMRWGDYFDGLARRLDRPAPPRDPARLQPPSCRCTNSGARAVLDWEPQCPIWPRIEQVHQTPAPETAQL